MLSKSGQIVDFREKEADSPSNLNNASIYIIEASLLKELDALRTEARLDVEGTMYDFGKHVFPALLGKLPYAKLSRDNLLVGRAVRRPVVRRGPETAITCASTSNFWMECWP